MSLPLDWTRGAGRPLAERPSAVDVIIPIYGAATELRTCLDSVSAETDLTRHRVVLVVDGPQESAVDSIVRDFKAEHREAVRVLRNDERLGFVGSVNLGMSASTADVVLLNSDTTVTSRWLEKLSVAAYSSGDIGTVTPLSNDATLCSVPRAFEANPLPSGFDVASFAALVERISTRSYPRLPTGVGMCLYIRRMLLEDIGLFDAARFGLGYGEENDFCMRALSRGWLHVADDATFIYHAGHASFGPSRARLQRKARAALRRIHPRYMATIAEFMRIDPLSAVRARIAAALPPDDSVASTVVRVIRGEGLPSAIRRTSERIAEASRAAALRARAVFVESEGAAMVNVAPSGISARLGGVQAQLMTRLSAERALRSVALLHPGTLELSAPALHARRIALDLETGVRDALAITGARTVHLEGISGFPLAGALRLIESGIDVLLSVHDFSLFCRRPHLLEEPMGQFCFYSQDLDRCHRCLRESWDVSRDEQLDWRALARKILASAKGLIFPSRFLLEQHRRLFSLPELAGEVIEPGVPGARAGGEGRAIAFAGSAKRHKGAHLVPEIARLAGNIEVHVFGGGDEDLLREMRRVPNIDVHGYYRRGELPSLLARHGIGLVILPSIWPESYGLVLSEAWLAGAAVVAFDLGAQAERIHRDGGGWLVPLESGAAGLAGIVEQWSSGRITARTPHSVPSPLDAARKHVEVYRKWGVL